MKFSIAGKVYDAADLDRVKMVDTLLLEVQTADMGHKLTWGAVGDMSVHLDSLKTEKAKQSDPVAVWFSAVVIWASRRLAGEDVTFAQALDFEMGDLRLIAEPEDRKTPANPTKARPGSGRAAKPRLAAPVESEGPSEPTSEGLSTAV